MTPAAAPPGFVLVAPGSSDNAAVFGRCVLELVTGVPVALRASCRRRSGLVHRDPEIALDVVQDVERKLPGAGDRALVALSNSFGFGGHNTVLALSAWAV